MKFTVPAAALSYIDDSRDAYTSVNASLKYEPQHQAWFAELFISNATNEIVQQWSNTGKGFPKGSFGMPRYYGVRAGFNF